jgi:hypothetical protein
MLEENHVSRTAHFVGLRLIWPQTSIVSLKQCRKPFSGGESNRYQSKSPRAKLGAGALKNLPDCLAVFYVEQVDLNRHAFIKLKDQFEAQPRNS